MLIELTVYWFPDNYDPEEYQDMGKEPEMTKGIIIINTNHVVAYNPHEDGGTMVRLTNGENFKTTYPFEDFNETMLSEQINNDLLVSKRN